MYVFVEKLKKKLSLNYHCHPLLSGALLRSCGTYANTYIEDILPSCLLYFILTKEQSCVSELAGDCVIKRYN